MTARGLGEQATEDGHYLLSREIIPINQTCLRCGADVGRRAIHDRWHDTHPDPTTDGDAS